MYNRAAMRAKDTVRCTNCRRLQARVDALEAELAALKQVVAQLGQQLAAARKDSSTSSKPPSSDIVKPPKPPPPRGPGPTPHRRAARPPQARTRRLPARGHQRRVLRSSPRRLPLVRPGPAAHAGPSRRGWSSRSTSARCRCRSRSTAVIRGGARTVRRCTRPRSRRGSSAAAWSGRRLTTLIAYLKGACHASFSTVRKFLRDVVRVTISRGATGQDHRQGQPGAGAAL